MKWIKIDKAKVKFNEDYLIVTPGGQLKLTHLVKTEQTSTGIVHLFHDDIEPIPATHVCLVSMPDDLPGPVNS